MRGGGAGRAPETRLHPAPLRRIDGTWALAPANEARPGAGPGTSCFGYLRGRPLGCRKRARVWTAQVEPAPATADRQAHRHAGDRTRTDPRGAELSRSLAHAQDPLVTTPPRHPWGPGDFKRVWGFGSREITGTKRRFALPWKRVFFIRLFGPCAG